MPLNITLGFPIDTMKPGTAAAGSPLDVGLVAYWNLNEASGTRVDASGHGRDLVPGTAPPSVTGLNGDAANFATGGTYKLQCTDTAGFNFGSGDFTLAGWAKVYTVASNRLLVTKFGNNPDAEFQLRVQTDARVNFIVYNNTTPTQIGAAGTPITLNVWNFIVAGRNGTTISIIVNNGTPVTGTFTGTMNAGVAQFVMGSSHILSGYSDAAMDDWGVWNRWLTAGEITTLYNAGAGREYPLP